MGMCEFTRYGAGTSSPFGYMMSAVCHQADHNGFCKPRWTHTMRWFATIGRRLLTPEQDGQAQFPETNMHLKCSQDSHRRACLSALDHRAFAARSVQALREATISPPEPGRMCTSMRSLLPGIFYTKWWMHPRNVVGLTLKFGIAMLIRTQMLWSKSWNGVPQINKLQDIILNFETQNPWWVINSKGCTEALPLLGSGPTLELLVRHNKLLVRAAIPPKRVDLIVYYCLHDAPCYP